MGKNVYMVQHSYELENGSDVIKIIGIFSSYQLAKEVVSQYITLPGFEDRPNDFIIDKYEVDRKYWSEGYQNWENL